MGIALPKWIIEGKNNIWVLGAYGLMFGGALPALVGRWWFGNRQKTKDGIHAESAAAFFKTVKEESSVEEVVGALGKAYKWEIAAAQPNAKLDKLEKTIKSQLGARWIDVRKLIVDYDGELHESRRRALVLLYAHLLRLDLHDAGLKKRRCKSSCLIVA
jgi:translocation protein SEC63